MAAIDLGQVPTMKFGVGQSVNRKEDPRLLTGAGCFTDDVRLDGQLFGLPVRSNVAHGIIRELDVSEAKAVPGVIAVYTAADMIAAGYKTLPCALPLTSIDGSPLIVPERPVMAAKKVHYLGEQVAFVVAESEQAARDGVEAVMLDIDFLPAVTDPVAALADGAPQIHPEASGNLCLHWQYGDLAVANKAFAEAAHVSRVTVRNNRVVVAAMESRGAIIEHHPKTGGFTMRTGAQGAYGMSNGMANLLNMEAKDFRVLIDDVGGSFGMKAPPYPEYIPLAHAARELGRPVGWSDDRSGSFVTDHHGRSAQVDAELALDGDGNFLAIRVHAIGDIGAYNTAFGAAIPAVNIRKNMPSCYKTPIMVIETRCVFTNTTPIGPYRGAGRPESVYYMERLVDQAARDLGRDPVELRRQNLIPTSAMPFTACSELEYDSGDFPAVMEHSLELADWQGFAARRAESASRGLLRGHALAPYLEVTAPPGKEMGGIRFEADGGVTIVSGTLSYGQGHASTFAQMVHQQLGIPFEKITLLQGDSRELLIGGGTGGSRSTMAASKAFLEAGEKVIEKGRRVAAHVLETAEADIEFAAGGFVVAGTDRRIALLDLATRAVELADLPDDLAGGLDAELISDTPPSSFPNGCHIAEVEIDPETGKVSLASYVIVDDFGTLVNPMLVEGQVHGGVAQGFGQAVTEQLSYGEDGQLLSGSFMDYGMPRADDLPSFVFASHDVPAKNNPLGVKGCGEAGCTGALPAIVNAIIDALSVRGITQIDMPTTPQRIWQALQGSK